MPKFLLSFLDKDFVISITEEIKIEFNGTTAVIIGLLILGGIIAI